MSSAVNLPSVPEENSDEERVLARQDGILITLTALPAWVIIYVIASFVPPLYGVEFEPGFMSFVVVPACIILGSALVTFGWLQFFEVPKKFISFFFVGLHGVWGSTIALQMPEAVNGYVLVVMYTIGLFFLGPMRIGFVRTLLLASGFFVFIYSLFSLLDISPGVDDVFFFSSAALLTVACALFHEVAFRFSRRYEFRIQEATTEALVAKDESDQLRVKAEKSQMEAEKAQSESEKLRQEAEKHADEVEELDQEKTAFFQNISHELRTPLTLILNPLEEESKGRPGNRNVEVATKNARRLLRLVNQLLDFQKLESAKQELKLSPINMVRFIYACGDYFESTCTARGIDFKVTLNAEEIQESTLKEQAVIIRGEVDALEKVIFNFLSNALKYTPRNGTIELGLDEDEDEENKKIRLFIKDSGPGISDEGKKKLFQVFSQVEESTTREFEGTGLGLALVKRLSEAMDGEVGLDSEVGQGSRFWSKFPIIEAPKPVMDVLLVEDDEAALRSMGTLLSGRKANLSCLLAQNAKEAREFLKNYRVKCVVSDEIMPGEGGVSFLSFVADTFPETHRVLVTGMAGAELLSRAINSARVDHVFTKPIEIHEFRVVVEGLVRTSSIVSEAVEEAADFEVKEWLLVDPGERTGTSDEMTGRFLMKSGEGEGAGRVVLVVDDLPDMRELIVDSLLKNGYQAVAASNGKSGLELATKVKPDLIITDWMMPKMSGPDFIKELKKEDSSLRSVPVILLTAKSNEESKLIGTEIGADAFLGKPFNNQELQSTVRNLIQLKEGEREAVELSAYLSRIFKAMTDGVIILDSEHRVTTVNSVFLDLMGMSEAKVIGVEFVELLEEFDIIRLGGMGSLLGSGSFTHVNMGFAASDGQTISLEVAGSPIMDEEKNFLGAAIVVHDTRKLQAVVAEQSRSMVELAKMNEEIKGLNDFITQSVLKRYLPPSLINEILDGTISMDKPAELRHITVLFSDLSDFTKLSEQLGPVAISDLLNDYLTVMSETIFDHDGTIDKFIGDAIMVIFGAPGNMEPTEQILKATQCASAMQGVLDGLNALWMQEGVSAMAMRIGIHHGNAVVGNFGSEQRSDYTAIGPTVNIASRIEGICKPGEVYISGEVGEFLDENQITEAGFYDLKGVGKINVYKLTP